MRDIAAIYQAISLHPIVLIGMFAVDWMLFSAELLTVGVFTPIGILISVLLTIPCILVQHGSGDNWFLAIGKGLIVGILTAIPTPLAGFLYAIPGAIGTIAIALNQQDVQKSP